MTNSIQSGLLAILSLALLSVSPANAATQTADTVYKNGFVYTVDGVRSRAEAFAVKDGKYIVVGGDGDMKEVTGSDTKVVNLRGKMVMPGLVDTHIHALRGALTALGLAFPVTSSVDDIKAAVKKFIADRKLKKGDWDNIPEPAPWFAMEGMVTRQYPGRPELGRLNPDERLDLETVIEIFTRNGIMAMEKEEEAGSIEPGKSAEFIVLNQNILEVPVEKIHQTKVLQGRTVYER